MPSDMGVRSAVDDGRHATSDAVVTEVTVQRSFVLLGVLATALAVSACGTSGDRQQARAVVERFYEAVREDDGQAACRQLGKSLREQVESQTGQECRAAITRFDYDGGAVVGAEVYVTNAKVDLRGGESAFLAQESGAWKLSAIACTAEDGKPADRPFDCEAES